MTPNGVKAASFVSSSLARSLPLTLTKTILNHCAFGHPPVFFQGCWSLRPSCRKLLRTFMSSKTVTNLNYAL
nr:hypothetical transcript [Hymenolepis microstoma]